MNGSEEQPIGELELQLKKAVPELFRAAKQCRVLPPRMLRGLSLVKLVAWYETNLANRDLFDPRGHQVVFDVSRFTYLIKICGINGEKLAKPLEDAEKIRCGDRTEKHYGTYDSFRAETLSWLPVLVESPLSIQKNVSFNIPADEVYVRRFQTKHFKYKVLYCQRMGEQLLVPVTSFRQHHQPKGEIIWPPK